MKIFPASSLVKTSLFLAITVSFMATTSICSAVPGYSTDFGQAFPNDPMNPQPIEQGFALSGQDNWDTTDVNQADYVGEIGGYSTTTLDNWAALGGITGVAPKAAAPSLFRPFDISAVNGGNGALLFNVDLAITPSTLSRSNRDTFSFIATGTGGNLFSIIFAPAGTTTMSIGLNHGPGLGTTTVSGTSFINYSSVYHLQVNVDPAYNITVLLTDSLGNPPTTVFSQNIADSAVVPSTVTQVSANWELVNTTPDINGNRTQYGANSLLLDNYSVVPEPSTIGLSIMAGIGGLGMVIRRRKQS